MPTSVSSTPLPSPPPEPTPTVQPSPFHSGKELVNDLIGLMQLRPGIGVAAQYSPGARAANFRVNVRFSNPFHPETSPWNYGIKFRDDGETYQLLVFDHFGDLTHYSGRHNELIPTKTVRAENMLTSGGSENSATFLVVEDRAFVLLNEALVSVFEVTEPDRVGEISLVTDIFNQTEVVGANTEFRDLVINSAGLIAWRESGAVSRSEPGAPAIGEFSLSTSAIFARITFLSPQYAFAGDFSFGLLFRNESMGIDNWITFDDNKAWKHVRSSTSGASSTLASGTVDGLLTSLGDENLIEFVSTGDQHKIYVNGEFITNVTFPGIDFPLQIAPAAAFEPTHQSGISETEYIDFIAWSLQP